MNWFIVQVSRYSKKEPPGHPYSSVEGGRWGAEEGVVADTASVTVGSCLSLMVYVSGDTGQQATPPPP